MEGIYFNLTAEEREQLAAAELAAKIAQDRAIADEKFCYSCASCSMDARISMHASRFMADKAASALKELRAKLGLK